MANISKMAIVILSIFMCAKCENEEIFHVERCDLYISFSNDNHTRICIGRSPDEMNDTIIINSPRNAASDLAFFMERSNSKEIYILVPSHQISYITHHNFQFHIADEYTLDRKSKKIWVDSGLMNQDNTTICLTEDMRDFRVYDESSFIGYASKLK